VLVQIFEVALSCFICCSRVCNAIRSARFRQVSTVTPISRHTSLIRFCGKMQREDHHNLTDSKRCVKNNCSTHFSLRSYFLPNLKYQQQQQLNFIFSASLWKLYNHELVQIFQDIEELLQKSWRKIKVVISNY
jgi:hypothetical protein